MYTGSVQWEELANTHQGFAGTLEDVAHILARTSLPRVAKDKPKVVRLVYTLSKPHKTNQIS